MWQDDLLEDRKAFVENIELNNSKLQHTLNPVHYTTLVTVLLLPNSSAARHFTHNNQSHYLSPLWYHDYALT
jgi:hypothetical protein